MSSFQPFQTFPYPLKAGSVARTQDIIKVLESAIQEFYPTLEKKPVLEKSVIVMNSDKLPGRSSGPMIIKGPIANFIYLSTTNKNWARYVYQFSHEFCHHVIDSDFFENNDRFGWLEESLCELASIYCLNRMSVTWQINPPYPHWNVYSSSLKSYVNDNFKNLEIPNIPMNVWFKDNLETLYRNRYLRDKNSIVALELFHVFKDAPRLWATIQYLKYVRVNDSMTLEDFVGEWKQMLPASLKQPFEKLALILTSKRQASSLNYKQ